MIITNKQSIYRATADTYVKRKPEVLALLRKHGYVVDESTPLEEIVYALDNSLRNNADFINEFSVLVAESGFVNAGGDNDENYYNADGEGWQKVKDWWGNLFNKNGGDSDDGGGEGESGGVKVPFGSVLSSVATALGSVFGFLGAQQQNQNIQAQSEADSQAALYNMIMNQQGKQGQSMKTATWITVSVLAALAIITTAVIISKKRKNA